MGCESAFQAALRDRRRIRDCVETTWQSGGLQALYVPLSSRSNRHRKIFLHSPASFRIRCAEPVADRLLRVHRNRFITFFRYLLDELLVAAFAGSALNETGSLQTPNQLRTPRLNHLS